MIIFFLTVFFASYLITYLIYQYALNKNWLDIPNERSSHETPTPRGGGLSVVIVFLISLLGLQQFNIISLTTHGLTGIIFSSLLVALIGFWDDHRSIPARWRFSVHIIASLLLLLALPLELPVFNFFGISGDLPVISFIFYLFFLAWLLNLYNFMDGIDGFASSEAISVCLSASLLLLIRGDTQWSLILILLSICVTGFLVWNWPPAKIFMGDVCSGFLGFILGGLALMSSLDGMINLWSWFILLAIFITDSSVTLGSRILKGEKWYQAHCTHAYQCYSQQLIIQFKQQGLAKKLARTKAHQHINLNLIITNICWLLPWAIVASFYPSWGGVIIIVVYTPLIIKVKQLRKNRV